MTDFGNVRAGTGKKPRKKPRGPRDVLCAFPKCDRLVRRDSYTGLCRDHVHTQQCRCQQCLRTRRERHVPAQTD